MSKYHATVTVCTSGHKHSSKLEAKRCGELHLLQRAGVIRNLVIEPQFWFEINGVQVKHDGGRRVGYKPDFQYFEGELNIVEDTKGFTVRDWPLRKAIFKTLFPHITFREIKR